MINDLELYALLKSVPQTVYNEWEEVVSELRLLRKSYISLARVADRTNKVISDVIAAVDVFYRGLNSGQGTKKE
jgi:hypothetical protein